MPRIFPLPDCRILVLVLGIAGCSGPALPLTAPVSGIVTLNGTPLTRGMVHFVPDNSKGSTGRMAVAYIQPDGRFHGAMCFKPNDGALIGLHKIAVDVRNVAPEPTQPGESPAGPPQPRSLVPIRYSNQDTSGLTVEVKAGTANEFEFALESR